MSTRTRPVAETLGRHFAALDLKDVPGEAVEKARLVILDALACAIAGWDTDVSRQSRALGHGLANPDGKATIWADGLRATPMDAVLVNTALVHSLLRDDSLPGTSTHGGSITVPTALAFAEHAGAPGSRVLLATIAAYDVQGRLGCDYAIARRITDKGHRGTPIFGPFAGAAAASVVLGLDGERLATALNLAANFSGGLLESMLHGTPEYRYQTANAARSGALAAMLAGQGAIAAPTTIDGRYGFVKVFADLDDVPEEVTAGLGERYEILRVMHKPYPTCGNNIRVVRTLGRAFAQRRLTPEDVSHIRLRVHPHSKNYPGCDHPGPFETIDQALLSTQFAVAAVLRDGRLTATTYHDIRDPTIADVARRVELVADPTVRVGLLDCRAEVTLRNGTRFEANATSDDDRMFNPPRDAATAEFHETTRHFLSENVRNRIVDVTLGLAELDDVRDLTSLLVSHPADT